MKTIIISNLVIISTALALSARGEVEPKILWGQQVDGWSLGIATTNAEYPQGVPPHVDVHLMNGSEKPRGMFIDRYHQQFNVVWLGNKGETLEETYPAVSFFAGSARGPAIIGFRGTESQRAASADILARLPPGRGTLTVFISMGTGADGNELYIYSGELQLQVRARTEADPQPMPIIEWFEDGYIGNRKRMISRYHVPYGTWTKQPWKQPPDKTLIPLIPSTLNKGGTPSVAQKSSTAASPVIATVATIATVSNGESPGSIFTPRNIIGATVVLGLLAIIASVLVRARSRQNSPP